jgi:hypothetical protein
MSRRRTTGRPYEFNGYESATGLYRLLEATEGSIA